MFTNYFYSLLDVTDTRGQAASIAMEQLSIYSHIVIMYYYNRGVEISLV